MEPTELEIPRFDLTGKTAIVTGAGSPIGIGRGIARTFAAYGANVVLADLDHIELEKRAIEIMEESTNSRAVAQRCDVRSAEDRDALVARAIEEFGRIDILVNNAGVGMTALAVDVDEEEWDRIIDTDLKAVFFLTQKVVSHMIEQKKGNIINLASVVARVASTRMMPYLAAKAGVLQMTRGMAFEWARFNIRANCICPGYINTNMTQDTLEKEKAYEAITRPIPHLRKVGDPLDIAAAALFLASDCTDMITGHPLYVDWGRSIW